MGRKKSPNTQNQTPKASCTALLNKADHTDEILNAMANTSIILMSTLMGAFTQVIVGATGAMASGMAEAMGGKGAQDQVDKEIKKNLPEVDEKVKAAISDIKKDIYSQMTQKRKELEPLLSDPAFDVGPKIIEKYDFNLPKLTQRLDDKTLAQYALLIGSEDICFAEMFKGLTEWISSLPKPPEKSNK